MRASRGPEYEIQVFLDQSEKTYGPHHGTFSEGVFKAIPFNCIAHSTAHVLNFRFSHFQVSINIELYLKYTFK